VVVLRYYEDLPEAQIAEVLGISQGTVKSQAHKAMRKMRILLPELAPALTRERGESR
jgi:RNA polymerase sigma factor (sigma-70 family)